MTSDYLKQGLNSIAGFFGGEYREEQIKMVAGALLPEPDNALREAYKRCCTEFNTMPTIAKVRDIIIQEGKKIGEAQIVEREREAAQAKADERRGWTPPKDEHGKACAAFLQAAFSGMYSHDELRELAEAGERQFPGRGFDVWLKGALKPKVIEMKQRASGEAA